MRNFVFSLLILSLSITGLFFDVILKSNNKSFAADSETVPNSQQSTVSIFIRQPTYSVFYNNKLYFIDEADNLLKSCNTTNNTFDSEYIELGSLKIIDSCFVENCWYLFAEDENNKNKVVKVDLDNFEIIDESEFDLKIENKYTSLFAQKIRFEGKDFTLITFSAEQENSKMVLIDEETETIEPEIEIKFTDTDEHNNIKDSLQKTVTYQNSLGELFILFFYDRDIASISVGSIDSLRDLSTSPIGSIMKTSIQGIQHLNIKNISFSKIDSVDYLALSLCSGDKNQQLINFYSFDFGSHQEIELKTQAQCKNANWINFNTNTFSYVDTEKQTLTYTKITTSDNGSGIIFTPLSTEIKNPQYKIEYFNVNAEDNTDENSQSFIYKKAKVDTAMFNDPWGSKSSADIAENTNIIQIGKAKLVGSEQEILDFDYCLYTHKNQAGNFVNKCGFIRSDTLEVKSEISPEDAGFSEIDGKYRVAIWPRTIFYNLPTIVTLEFDEYNDDGIDVLDRRKFSQIPSGEQIADNLDVYVIDMLGNYVANNVQMVKVEVNGKIGYIDAKCIRKPSDVKNFVITNATIKNDETVVYTSADHDSPTLSFKLQKGKNVRINGKRDTQTGFTSITFNDELGNEYSGYIETDYIKSDSWSTLQIIGCILIAINIGLLILILIYKKRHLGNRGQKIDAK